MKKKKVVKKIEYQELQYITFNIGRERLSLDIINVQEIIKVPVITHVPLCSNFVEGIINIRGDIFPVINLGQRMNFLDYNVTNKSKIIIISLNGRKVGLLVDDVNEVVNVTEDKIQKVESESNIFIKAIISSEDELISILNLDKVLEVNKV